jgi:M6 family metalloprotease-like protein
MEMRGISLYHVLAIGILICTVTAPHFFSILYVQASTVSTYDSNGVSGAQTTIVIPVEFKDVKHHKTREEIGKSIFGDLNRYITEVSYSAASVTGYTNDWITLPHEISYYGRDSIPGLDSEIRQLFRDSIQAVDNQVNFTLYEHIMIIHAGKGQETSGVPSDIWSEYIRCNPPVYADGLAIKNVMVVPEEEAAGKDPLGVVAHEFMHSLGLPDLYPAYGLKSKYLDCWDLMDHGFCNGKPPGGSSPAQLSAWSRLYLGWPVKTKTIYAGSLVNITLSPLEAPSSQVQVVILPVISGKYYLIEVRQQLGFDQYLPSHGVLITEVNEKLPPQSGMVKVVNANPKAPGLGNATFKVGQSYNDSSRLVRVTILSEDGACTLLIDRTLSK